MVKSEKTSFTFYAFTQQKTILRIYAAKTVLLLDLVPFYRAGAVLRFLRFYTFTLFTRQRGARAAGHTLESKGKTVRSEKTHFTLYSFTLLRHIQRADSLALPKMLSQLGGPCQENRDVRSLLGETLA